MTLTEGIDFNRNSKGEKVFTKEYLKKRGWCCGSGCTNCPYIPKHKRNKPEKTK